MLNWVNQFNICCFLDNNGYQSTHHSIECLLGAGARHSISASSGTAFARLKEFGDAHHDWIFGHLGYDLKNETENVRSSNSDHIKFPDLFFFVPEIVIELTADVIRIGTFDQDATEIFDAIGATDYPTRNSNEGNAHTEILQRYTRAEYIETINQLKRHILRGDCYEINFCQEFYVEDILVDPLLLFQKLLETSPNPFAAYYKIDDKFLICASPERYLKKTGLRVVSQPIKGTLKRDQRPGPSGGSTSDSIKTQELKGSEKDRSENVMVVDLVRNDLSKICVEGSVQVEELFNVYTFPQVYQMISTITGELPEATDWMAIIQATFPMGSMTGAPKRKVLDLIERYERTKRGIFSGAVGYISPDKDFDFNVVIRSMMYNATERYLALPAGSGITFYSDPEAEYEECLVKLAAIRSILQD